MAASTYVSGVGFIKEGCSLGSLAISPIRQAQMSTLYLESSYYRPSAIKSPNCLVDEKVAAKGVGTIELILEVWIMSEGKFFSVHLFLKLF